MKLTTLLALVSLVYSSLCAPELVRRTYRLRKSSSLPGISADKYDDVGDYFDPRQSQYQGQNNTDVSGLYGRGLPNFSTSPMPPQELATRMLGKRRKPITHLLRRDALQNAKAGLKSRGSFSKINLRSVSRSRSGSSLSYGLGSAIQSKHMVTGTKRSNKASKVEKALNMAPTPQPSTPGSALTTVHINDADDFALLLPKNPNELIGDAEVDGVAYCTSPGCAYTLPEGFVTAAVVTISPDNSSWIQVTGCLDPSKLPLSPSDDGGQFDVRFPDGAQCTFGGYGASFIEQVEPSANRFCLRCCADANDQSNCNSHQDRAGCPAAIPGVYDFPEKGISCS